MKKFWAAVLCLVLAAALMAGCAKKPDELIKSAMENSSNYESSQGWMDMTLGMNGSASGINMDIEVNMHMNYATIMEGDKPAKMKMDGNLSMMGMDIPYEMYARKADSGYEASMKMGEEWSVSEGFDVEAFNNTVSFDPALFKNLTAAGKEKVGNTDCTKITGTMAPADMMSYLEMMGGGGFNVNNDSFSEETLKELTDVNVTVWVSESENRVVQITMDGTEMMNAAMLKSLEESGESLEGDDSVAVSAFNVTFHVSSINDVEDFEIPAEAFAAAE
ncbi:LolA-like protein [Gehongia tenuis]|uniref:Lipoprotein n=1 Tax=Gehongia tenuis TaxID=2763655 RepID=A0A926HPD6_9FIRM|nr:hypothetical protein [Gehongia tenuis]MBC8530585.1 hypothetical protein [Gehongia tenuis]